MQSADEVFLAVQQGASAIGFTSEMPSGFGPVSESLIVELSACVPPGVASFLLTSLTNARAIIEQHKRCGTNVLQIVDDLVSGTLSEIAAALPSIQIVQVVHIVGPESIEEAQTASQFAHALLLDSGNPHLQTKELGGTGRVHDWAISREIREKVDVPVYLAGGLTPENVEEAVEAVRPFGVDVCTGVRTDGVLDKDKLAKFFQAVSNVDRGLTSG
jgi:phosphoribosylanthranilate isomerase